MPYEVELPNGTIVEGIPDDMPRDEVRKRIIAAYPDLAPKPEKESALRQAADVPLNVTKGVVSGVRMLSDVFGADNPISKSLRGVEDYVGDLLSAQAKNDQKEISRIMKEAEDKGVLEQIKAGLNAFIVAPVDLMSQAFGTVIPTLAGGLAGAGLKIGAKAAGALTGAAMGAGTGKSAIYDAVVEELSQANLPKEVIEQAATKAQEYGGKNLDLILANTLLGGIAGTTGIEKALIPGLSKRITEKVAQRGVLTRAAATGLPEAGTEFLQGGTEQASKNIALQREGYDVPTMRGVYSAGTMEGAAGFGMGAAAGALRRQTATEQPVVEPPAGEAPVVEQPQERFTPTVIPQAYSTQEGIDRATGVNAESGYTAADLLTPSAEGVREQAQQMATRDLNAVGTPRPRMTEEGRLAAQQAAFARADQEQGFTDQRQPMPVSPSQAVPYTAPAPVTNEERRKLVDAQSAELARAQNEPFEFDRRRLEASASAVGGTGQVRGTPRAVLADPNPMVPRAARQRLAVMKEEAAAKGEDPNALVIVPHPTMGGRFAIEQRSMEQPYVAPPIETPTVSQAEAQRRIEASALAGSEQQRLAQDNPRQQMISRAMAAIESRGGVASPREAQLLREANMGQPYNSIDNSLEPQGSVDERLTQATGIELQRTPRESVRGEDFARTAEFNAEQAQRRLLEQQQKIRETDNLVKATNEAPIPPQPKAVMAAFATPAPLRTAEQVATINQARARLNPSDLSVLEMAGQDPSSMKNAVERIQKEHDAKYSLTDVVATPEAKAMADDVRKKLLPILKRFGLEKMGLRLVDSIEGGAEGMYFKSVITLALNNENPMGVMRHEVIHALKELGAFTNGEWKVLTDMAKKKWINQFYSPETQAEYKAQYEKDGDTTQTFDEYMAEEAIAQAFRFYTETKPPSGMIANLMRRLNNVFAAIREFFMGNGVTNGEQLFLAKSIFSNIESGRMTAGRAGVGKEGAPKFSKSMQPTGDITPMSVQGIRIYNKEIETLTKKIGDRIAGMTTEQTVEDVRKAVKKLQSYTAKGLQGREWYERSAKAVLDAFNGDPVLAEKLFQIIAITSANTEVSANFTKTVNAWNQFAQGKPIKVGTKDTNKKIEALLYFGVDWEGRKTNTFYTNLLEAMDGKDTGRSTIDLHMTRMIFDKDQPTDAQYELAEKMVSLLAAKMNVPPRQVQAASWVTQKAKGMFADYRRRGLKSDLNDNELREFAFERAVTDYSHLMKAKVKQLPITKELSEPSPSIRARTQVITGEAIPSVKTEMSQMEEMSFPQKEKFTKDILKSGAITSLADALGIQSRIRVTVGSGAYEGKVNPNLKVQVVNSNSATAEKDARDLAYAMSYVFKQDATPFFRADPSLLNKDQYGIAFKFNRELTPAMQKKMLDVMKSYLGADAGFSKVNSNEIVMINYRGEDGNPFLMSDPDFILALEKAKTDLNNLMPIESNFAFGAKSEYPYHDWQEDGAGNAIVERLQNSRADRPDLQQRLNDLRESFVGTAREAVEKTGAKPRFSLRPEQLALRPSDSGGTGVSFNNRKEDAVSYAGSHYGKAKTNILSGGYSGTGLKGAEAKRLAQAKDARIGKRVYFYIPRQNGTMPYRESGVGNHVYTQKFDNILGPGKTMSELYKKAQGDSNAFESFVIDNGYDGYAVPDYGMMVVLNNDIEAKYEGTVGEVHYNKTEPEKGARFSRALGALEPATFLVPDTSLNNTGNLGVMPDARGIEGKPIRLAVGMEDANTSKGYGATHILKRIEKDATRKPPVASKELLEDLIRNVEKTAQSFTRLYRDRNNLIAYNPITTESLVLAERPDHYSVITSYRQNNMGKYGNIAWTGKTPTEFKRYLTPEEPQKGIPVKAGASGVVRQPVATTFKRSRVMSPEAIQEMADDLAKTKLQGKASLRTPPALLKQTLTDSFKRWFGKSAIVDMNGDPKVMYHGTAQIINEFMPKQANAIFVTDEPDFAKDFSRMSESHMAEEFAKGMYKFYQLGDAEAKFDFLKRAYAEGVKNKEISKAGAKETLDKIKLRGATDIDFSNAKEFMMEKIKDQLQSRANIMPLFVRAENPFDYENPTHVDDIVAELNNSVDKNGQLQGEQDRSYIERGVWEIIETPRVQKAIKKAKHDGFYAKENGEKNLAVYNPNQVKSATGNTGAFSRKTGDIRYSLTNNVPPAVHTKLVPNQSAGQQVTAAATNAIKAVREDGFFTNLRNGFVDETSSLGHTLASRGMSQFANNKLRADMLKHTQANSINIMTVGLQSGVPVLNSDGSIVIKRTESNMARSLILADKLDSNPYVKASKLKGGRGFVAEVARALRGADIKEEDAAMNAEGQKLIADADAMEISLNAAVKAGGLTASAIASEKGKIDKLRKEGKELADKNREKQVDDAQIQWAEAQLKNVPELKEIFGIWKDINNALTDLSEDTGVISKEQADKYRDKKFYVPLFKAREDLAEAFFRGSTAKNVAKNYKLEGADIDRNIWENLQKQYAMTIAVAYENQTRKVATEQLQGFGLAKTVDNPNDPNINLRYKEDGKIVNVIAENPNDIAAFQMMNYELGPIMKAISATTKVLRFGALVNPMFWIKQLIRDPIHASLTNSQIVTPFNSLVGFVKVLNKSSASAKILAERGVIGAVDSTVDLNEYIGQLGKEKKTPQMLSSALHKVMQIHEASDAATRVAIFDSAKKEALKKGMSEEEAINFAVFRARESINFGVRGNSQALNTLRHSIPFFQAAITSLDTVYRAATGYGLPPAEKRKAQIIFAKRAAVMALMSTLYAAMYTDDDEYKDLPDYVKDGNWLFPTTTPDGRKTFVKIPVPFEIGFLFKTIPEAAWRYYTGTSTGKEVGKSYLEGLIHNLPGGGIIIPQAFKPALEVMTNHSFFTGNPIEGMSDQGKPVVERGRNASEFSKAASQAGLEKVGLSPAKIDALFKGYFAELGGTFLMVTSDLLGSDKPTKNIEAQLGAKAFMTDPKVSKAVSDFYTLEHNAKEMTNMFTSLKKDGLFDRAREYIDDEDKKKQLIAAPVFRKIGEQLGKIKTEMRRVEAAEGMSGDDKQARINELQKMLTQTAKRGYEVAERAGISR
jgi:hypothetical protein